MEDEERKENEPLSDRIIFKKRINAIVKDKISDPVELHLEYAEAVSYVLNNLCPLNEETATTYASLILQVRYGDCSANSEVVSEYTLNIFSLIKQEKYPPICISTVYEHIESKFSSNQKLGGYSKTMLDEIDWNTNY
jgi:hypothetical protein